MKRKHPADALAAEVQYRLRAGLRETLPHADCPEYRAAEMTVLCGLDIVEAWKASPDRQRGSVAAGTKLARRIAGDLKPPREPRKWREILSPQVPRCPECSRLMYRISEAYAFALNWLSHASARESIQAQHLRDIDAGTVEGWR